uniref:NADH dehydrogenase subunit 4 n=1 Tax=Pilargis verrucosa TaxID=1818081 RepID=UPI0030E569DA
MLMLTIMATSLLLLPIYTQTKKSWTMSIIGLTMTFMSSVILLYSPMLSPSYISKLMILDTLSSPLISLTLWISPLMLMASSTVLNNNNSAKSFTSQIIALNLILIITFSSNNLLMFYIAFESSLIPTLLLILGWGYQPERLQASMYLMLYTVTASLPLLMSLMYIYKINNHLMINFPMWNIPPLSTSMTTIWWLITITAFLVKMPLYLTHLWLPKAHVEAPVAGSMILAGILLKLGSYGMLRVSFLFQKSNSMLTSMISSIALWGALITSMICIRQTDLKSLIAYSSVGHMGLMTAGIMSNSSWGWNSSLTLMIAHGLCSSSLFAIANMTYESTQTRNLFLTKGLLTLFPNLTMWWFLASMTNMAGPPSINLLSEIMLITSTLFTSTITCIILSMMSFLAATYSLYLYSTTQHGSPLMYSNLLNLLSPLNYSTLSLHIIPIYVMIMKPSTLTTWL